MNREMKMVRSLYGCIEGRWINEQMDRGTERWVDKWIVHKQKSIL